MGYLVIKDRKASKRLSEKPQDGLKRDDPYLDMSPERLQGELLQSLTDTDRDGYEERTGIMRYDGGLSQAEAEQEALRLILRGKLCDIPDNCELRDKSLQCLHKR